MNDRLLRYGLGFNHKSRLLGCRTLYHVCRMRGMSDVKRMWTEELCGFCEMLFFVRGFMGVFVGSRFGEVLLSFWLFRGWLK